MLLVVALCLSVSSAHPRPAPAPPPAAKGIEADPAFKEGRKLYDAFEYEQAVFRFEKVAVKAGISKHDQATALVWLGLSYAGGGDFDSAKRAFSDACRADTTITMPIEVSKKLRALFDDAKASAVKEAQAPPPPTTPIPTLTHETATAPTPTTTQSSNMPLYAGIGAAVGGALVVAGAGAGVMCALSYGRATDRTQFASNAKAALDEANAELVAATILVPIGVAVGSAAGFILLSSP